MNKTFENAQTKAEVRAISSKSEAHRALICAALSDAPCFVECNDTNNDIDATARCLCALGAKIERRENGFFVDPISKVSQNAKLDAGESGSTLRFLIPLAAALGANCRFLMRGRLPHRPLSARLKSTDRRRGALRRKLCDRGKRFITIRKRTFIRSVRQQG